MPKLYIRGRTFWADCTYVDSATGRRKRHQRSTGIRDDGTAQTRRTAAAAARDIEGSLAGGKGLRPRGTPLRKALENRLNAQHLAQRAEASQEITTEKFSHLLRHFGREHDANEITADDLVKYATEARKKRGPGSVARELVELAAAMRASGIEPPELPDLGRTYRPRELAFDAAQSRALIEQLPESKREHAIMYRLLGLSWSELYRITPQDIDWARNSVRVRGTKRETRDRTMPMPAQVAAILHARVFAKDLGEPLFERWDYGNGNRDLTQAAIRAGLVPRAAPGAKQVRVSFNVLRASFCTELVLSDVHPVKIAKLMGHANTRMVEGVYTRLRPAEHLAEAMAVLEHLGTPPARERDVHDQSNPADCNAGAAEPLDADSSKDTTTEEKSE